MDTSNWLMWVVVFFLVTNLLAFLVMLWDKSKSRKNNAKRISEGMMFFMATIFGSLGIFAGMFAFRHKTRKWYFIIGIPMLMIQNVAFLYVVYILLSNNY